MSSPLRGLRPRSSLHGASREHTAKGSHAQRISTVWTHPRNRLPATCGRPSAHAVPTNNHCPTTEPPPTAIPLANARPERQARPGAHSPPRTPHPGTPHPAPRTPHPGTQLGFSLGPGTGSPPIPRNTGELGSSHPPPSRPGCGNLRLPWVPLASCNFQSILEAWLL